MKMTNYRLQTEIENIKPNQTEWFKNYLKEVLESDKPYYVKADYIGLSLKEIDNKIAYITHDIKELQSLKKQLQNAKSTAVEVTAEVLGEYGIERLDGNIISSLTITPASSKLKEHFKIIDEDALIKLGYFRVVVDEDAVKEAMSTLESMDEIDPYVEVGITTEEIPAKVKVNTRRSQPKNQASELIELVQSQQQAA